MVGTCAVHNVTQGQFFGPDDGDALRSAIGAATSRDVLEVTGTCAGNFKIGYDRVLKLTLRGADGEPRPVLSGGAGFTLEVLSRHSRLTGRRLILNGTKSGGVVRNEGGQLSLTRVDIRDAFGLGLFNRGTATINRSTVTRTGGIYSYASPLTIRNSRLTHNHKKGDDNGGAIWTYNDRSSLVVEDSFIAHNSAQNGGGILNQGPATITNTQIVDNKAAIDGGGIYAVGRATLVDSVILDNTPNDCVGRVDC
jgi:hypothetical protein